MATVRDLLNKVRQGKAELIANRENDALKVAFDQIALVKLRIQSTGEAASGQKFPDYTAAYKSRRENEGYQVKFVDLTKTGKLMASISATVEKSDVFSATILIQADDELSQKILRGFFPKRGNVLEPSKEELEIIRAANRQRIYKYFNF